MRWTLLKSLNDQCRINTVCATVGPLNEASEYDHPKIRHMDFEPSELIQSDLEYVAHKTNNHTRRK
jgi:hypothetical protein